MKSNPVKIELYIEDGFTTTATTKAMAELFVDNISVMLDHKDKVIARAKSIKEELKAKTHTHIFKEILADYDREWGGWWPENE